MGKTLVIDIQDGKVSIDASGYTGLDCLKETQELEAALGVVESQEMKASAQQNVYQTVRNS